MVKHVLLCEVIYSIYRDYFPVTLGNEKERYETNKELFQTAYRQRILYQEQEDEARMNRYEQITFHRNLTA